MKKLFFIMAVIAVLLMVSASVHAKTAVIIASFGTTVPRGLQSVENITARVKKAFPQTTVKVVFTSNIIRSVWEQRSRSPEEWLKKGVPKEILYTKNLLSTFGELKRLGFKDVIVQPTHLFHMEQYHDLMMYVNAIASIKTIRDKWRPFHKIALGRPALGCISDVHPYREDLAAAVLTFAADVSMARQKKAALVYMGHGNEIWSTGVYAELEDMLNTAYPDVKIFIGAVEGYPGIDQVYQKISAQVPKAGRLVLKPLMIVAGDHAVNDMAGDDDDSWKSLLTRSGYNVEIILQGLGSNNQFADLFVNHIKDAATDSGIDL